MRSNYGVASWILIIVVVISLLLTIAFAAQNIRLRVKLAHADEEIATIKDQSTELEQLQSQVDSLSQKNKELSQQLDSAKTTQKSLESKLEAAKKAPKTTSKSSRTTSTRRRR